MTSTSDDTMRLRVACAMILFIERIKLNARKFIQISLFYCPVFNRYMFGNGWISRLGCRNFINRCHMWNIDWSLEILSIAIVSWVALITFFLGVVLVRLREMGVFM